MGALILRVSARHGRAVEFHRIPPEGFSVGRGLGNALIVPDPYLGAEQFRLLQEEERVLLEVLDHTNPLSVNGLVRTESRMELRAGDRIETGRSVFTLLDTQTPLPPALSLAASPWERLGQWRAPLALSLVLVAAAVIAGIDFLKSTGTPQWDELALSGLSVVGLSTMWAAFWAGLSGILRHHADFWVHFAMAGAAGMLWYGGLEVSSYLAYAFADDAALVLASVGWLLGALMMFLMAAGALALATPLRQPWLAALGATIGAFGLMGLQDFAERNDFSPQPQPVTVLRAPFAKPRPGLDYPSFDARVSALFASLPEED